MKKQTLFLMVMLAVVLVLAVGCQNPATTTEGHGKNSDQSGEPVELTISAAASLKDVMGELQEIYKKVAPEITLTFTFDSSGTLQQQIEQGAPVDVFLSAALKQMNTLQEKGLLLDDTITELLENKVVLIAPKDQDTVSDFQDLAGEDVKAIAFGEPSSVPVGQYTEEIINYLGIKDVVAPKVVYAKNVREVLAWVETGNADVGVVYATDAQISDKIVVVAEAPANSHQPVIYPAAVIKDSKRQEEAIAFLAFLKGDEAGAIFEKYGFSMVN